MADGQAPHARGDGPSPPPASRCQRDEDASAAVEQLIERFSARYDADLQAWRESLNRSLRPGDGERASSAAGAAGREPGHDILFAQAETAPFQGVDTADRTPAPEPPAAPALPALAIRPLAPRRPSPPARLGARLLLWWDDLLWWWDDVRGALWTRIVLVGLLLALLLGVGLILFRVVQG